MMHKMMTFEFLVFSVIACITLSITVLADRVYCGNGSDAVIAEDFTVYDGDGKASAYVYLENGNMHVYGFNGKHLGWLLRDCLYDHDGNVVATACVSLAPLKGLKPLKSLREIPPLKPILGLSPSNIPLSIWLASGLD